MSRIKLVFIIPLVVTLLALSLLGACAKPEEKVIKIGVAMDLSSFAAGWGVPMSRNMQWLVDRENAKGGLLVGQDRYRLELVIEDTRATPEGAAAAAKKLLEMDEVDLIIGGIMAATGLAIQAITEPAGVIFGTEANPPRLISPENPHSFRNSPCVEQIPIMANWHQKHWPEVKKIAIIWEHGESGRANLPYLTKFHSMALDIVATEYAEMGVEDYRPVLSRVLQENPDALEIGLNPPESMALMMKQSRELGFKGPFWTIYPITPGTLLEVAGKEAVEGVCGWTAPTEGEYAPEMSKEFKAYYLEKWGEWDAAALAGDCCLAAFLQAIEVAGTTDTDEVIKVLQSGMEFDTFFGKSPFGLEGFYGIANQSIKSLAIKEMHDGEDRFIDIILAEDQVELFNSLGWKAE